jgi:hypothetical protein
MNIFKRLFVFWMGTCAFSTVGYSGDFEALDAPGIPAPVAAAAESVFRLIPYSDTRQTVDIRLVLSVLDKPEAQNPLPPGRFRTSLKEKAQARLAAGETRMPFPYVMSDSAVLVGRGDRLLATRSTFWQSRSSLHIANNKYAQAWSNKDRAERVQESLATVPEFALLDAQGALVFDTQSEAGARFGLLMLPSMLSEFLSKNPRAQVIASDVIGTDLVVIHLPRVIGKPISPAPRLPEIGETVFSVGYPIRAEGHGERLVSHGPRRAIAATFEKGAQYDRWMMAFDATLTRGSAGSAALNADGEFVGIVNHRLREDKRTVGALATTVDALKELEKLYRTVQNRD